MRHTEGRRPDDRDAGRHPGNTDEVVAANPVGKAALPTRALRRAEGSRQGGRRRESAGAATVLDVLGSRDPKWNKPGEAVLGQKTAGDLGLKQGQEVPVRFADGATVTLRVAKVLPDDPARGDFVVARDLVRAHDPAALTDDIFVPGDAKASAAVPESPCTTPPSTPWPTTTPTPSSPIRWP